MSKERRHYQIPHGRRASVRQQYTLDVASRSAFFLFLVAVMSNAQHFPPLDQHNPPKSRTIKDLSFCMTARKSIPQDSSTPLFTFDFVPDGSGSVVIDGKTVETFKNEPRLVVYEAVSAGKHTFELHMEKPTVNTFMVSHEDFKYCKP
jgi:hypothetical protein